MKAEAKQWLKIAEGDYKMSQYGFKMARYPQALYLLCQAIEKVLKGAQIEFAGKTPQRTHRLETIAKKTGLDFSDRQYELLIELTQHYGRVRYPDYSQIAYSTKKKAGLFSTKVKQFIYGY